MTPFPATRLELAARVADEPNLGRQTMTTITGHGISAGADLPTESVRRLMSGALDGTRCPSLRAGTGARI